MNREQAGTVENRPGRWHCRVPNGEEGPHRIQLPEISGLEVNKWLKEDEELAHIPVVAVTAFAMKGDEERIREGGCEAYISKPISVTHFLETIRRLLA